jgi:dTDP-4-dehydrorhamnose reductase
MSRIWVTGAAGLIGNTIVKSASRWAPDFEMIPLGRGDFDLTDFTAVDERFRRDDPDGVIHCAGMSRPTDCEMDLAAARSINADATGHLAELFADRHLVYLSTDIVLDGCKGAYVEEDSPNPLNDYGRTKLAGEEAVRKHRSHTVVRLALNFGQSIQGDRAFNEQMHRQLAEGKAFSLFEDEYRTPLSAEVTARALWELTRHRVGGLFLLGGAEKVSRWQIGKALYERWGDLPGQIRPGSLKDYDGPPRAADLSLNCRKIQALLSFPLPGFHEWLAANPAAKI